LDVQAGSSLMAAGAGGCGWGPTMIIMILVDGKDLISGGSRALTIHLGLRTVPYTNRCTVRYYGHDTRIVGDLCALLTER
jgi:hypothetical protein